MLILICRIGNRLEYLPGVCRISFYTYVTNGAFEDPIDWSTCLEFVELVFILM